jgi:hypothetical protein
MGAISLPSMDVVKATKLTALTPEIPINLHWACVVGYGPFSICVIHKEGPSSGVILRLMIMMMTPEILRSDNSGLTCQSAVFLITKSFRKIWSRI